MSSPVKWIVGVVLAVLLFAGGYMLGERKVGLLEEQNEALRQKQADADTARKNSQIAMDKALKTQADENAKQLETLKADAERSRKELAAANDRNAELEKLEKQRKAAAKRKGKGGTQAAELARCNSALAAAGIDPKACLALAVPKPAIAPLTK